MDLRRRSKGPRRQRQQAGDVGIHPGQDRQHTVVAGADLGDEPVGDFLLQHQDGVAHAARGGRQVEQGKQDGRGDVVGEVTHDSNGVIGAEGRTEPLRDDGGQIDLEHIAKHQCQVGGLGRIQFGGEVPVHLDGQQSPTLLGERPRDGRAARADLENIFIRLGVNSLDDLRHPRRFQKVLAESLSCPHAFGSCFSSSPSSAAATSSGSSSPSSHRSS